MNWVKWMTVSILSLGLTIGCGENNGGYQAPKQNDNGTNNGSGDDPNAPAEMPTLWSQVRRTITFSENNSECQFQEFRIGEDGLWSFTRCEREEGGALTQSQVDQLTERANAVLRNTEIKPCAEVLILDQYYIHLQSKKEGTTHTFDPQDACFEGGETQVNNLREFLETLQNETVGSSNPSTF